MARDTPETLVAARRADEAAAKKGRCIACGSPNAKEGGAADPGAVYRILRGGMHVGNLALTRDDHLCIFCRGHGKVR